MPLSEARADRIEAVEFGQADEDRKAAIVRLSRLGMSRAEIAHRLKERGSKAEAVLAEYDKKRSEE
jgi:hypothetical protein